MFYSVAEVSESTGLTKQSIYSKLKLKELEDHITKKQGKTYIDDTGFNLIKDSLKTTTDDLKDLNIKEIDNTLDDETITDREDTTIKSDKIKNDFNNIDIVGVLRESLSFKDTTIEELRHDIKLLWKDNQEKNNTIRSQSVRISELTNKLTDSLDKAHELHQNTQVLFKQSMEQNPQNTPLLEEHFNELDNKLMEVREQMALRKESYDTKFNKKGLLNKLFRK